MFLCTIGVYLSCDSSIGVNLSFPIILIFGPASTLAVLVVSKKKGHYKELFYDEEEEEMSIGLDSFTEIEGDS